MKKLLAILVLVLGLGLTAWMVFRSEEDPSVVEMEPAPNVEQKIPEETVTEQNIAPSAPHELPASEPQAAVEPSEETMSPADEASMPAAVQEPNAAPLLNPDTTLPQPKDLKDTAAVQDFLTKTILESPNSWNKLPLFRDREKIERYFKGLYKGPLIGLDGKDLQKELEIDFSELQIAEENNALSGQVTLAIYNTATERYERKSQPSGHDLTMFRQSPVQDSITVSWRGGRPSKELLQIFFPKNPDAQGQLFGTFYRKEKDNILKPAASFVITRQNP